MIELTKTQRRVYVLLKRRWKERGSQPNLRDLSREMNIHYVSLKQHLDALAKKDYLELESQGRGKQPIIRLSVEETGVPLVGEIAAGGLSFKEEHIEGYLRLAPKQGRFSLRVRGDSMSEWILDNDIVLLEREKPHSGQICAVRLEDETTLKYLDYYNDGSAVLRPHNPDFDPIDVSLEDIDIAGVYVGHISGALVDELFLEAA